MKLPLPMLSLLLAAPLILLPREASACGVCTDIAISKLAWWAAFPLWLLAALLVDYLGFSVFRLAKRIKSDSAVLRGLLLVAVSMVLLAIGAGTILTAAFGALALGVWWIRSFACLQARNAKERRLVTRIRVGISFAIVIGFAIRALPPFVPTSDLLHKAIYWPTSDSFTKPGNWVERELKRRKASPDVERLLDEEVNPATGLRLPSSRSLYLLRLHFLFEGDPSARRPWCETFAADQARHWEGIDAICPR